MVVITTEGFEETKKALAHIPGAAEKATNAAIMALRAQKIAAKRTAKYSFHVSVIEATGAEVNAVGLVMICFNRLQTMHYDTGSIR